LPPYKSDRLIRATEKYQRLLARTYDRWVRELSRIAKQAIASKLPRASTMALVDEAIEILIDHLCDVNRAGMMDAYVLGYGRAPDVKGMQRITESIEGFRDSLESKMGPKLRADIDRFLEAQNKPKTLAIDPFSLPLSLGAERSNLLSGGGGFWAIAIQGAGDKVGLIDTNRGKQDLPPTRVKWVLDPGADHCEASPGYYGCPDLAGEYDSWDDLPTVPGGQVTCRGRCRCEIQIIAGKDEIDIIDIAPPQPKQISPIAAIARRVLQPKKAPIPEPDEAMIKVALE